MRVADTDISLYVVRIADIDISLYIVRCAPEIVAPKCGRTGVPPMCVWSELDHRQ